MWINGFSGNATDSFSGHNGSEFSTVDNINDRAPKCCPCARAYGGGWWFHRYVWDFWLVDIAEQPIKRLEISKNVLHKGKNMISRVFFSCNFTYTKMTFFFHYSCFESNLNGEYHENPLDNDYYRGIIWELWRGDYSLKSSKMMIRSRAFQSTWKNK